MSLDEETLHNVARDGEMDYAKWPAIVDPLLDRLQHIVYNEFPIPRPYANINRPPEPSSPTQDRTETIANAVSQAPTTPVRNLPPVPLFPNSSATSTSHVPDSLPPSQPPSSPTNALDTLPAPLIQLLQSITTTLHSSFTSKPPHTIQRLAELVLNPNKHYKTLPAWLRAIDRVVNVSSSADIFPLSDAPPPLVNGVNGDGGGGILWKNDTNGYDRDSLGSDESLGGALLTPIPWLRNGNQSGGESGETDDSKGSGEGEGEDDGLGAPIELPSTGSGNEGRGLPPAVAVTGHADPLVPERDDGAVTQGELIRMEQEAGVVPVAVGRPIVSMGDGSEMDEGEDLVPHARGPDIVGAVDMGKVDGKDVQVRIGSPPEERKPADPNDAQEVLSGSGKEGPGQTVTAEGFEIVGKEDEENGDEMQMDDKAWEEAKNKEKDEDIVLVDADGKMEDE